jgi:hypothetical protein
MKRLMTTVFFGLLLTGYELPPANGTRIAIDRTLPDQNQRRAGYSPGHAVGRIHQETIISQVSLHAG